MRAILSLPRRRVLTVRPERRFFFLLTLSPHCRRPLLWSLELLRLDSCVFFGVGFSLYAHRRFLTLSPHCRRPLLGLLRLDSLYLVFVSHCLCFMS